MTVTTEIDKPQSEERIRKNKLKAWTNTYGLYCCPKCKNVNIAHLTIANKGEVLVCKNCGFEEVVAEEERKIRRGYRL